MDMKRLERTSATRLQNDEAETLARLAAGLWKLDAGEGAPGGEGTDMAHALRRRRGPRALAAG